MNKKGQIFEFLLFLITVAMCGTVILLYFTQQKNAENSLISPAAVFETRDQLENFEMLEGQMISDSLGELGTENFGTKKFADDFRNIFLEKLKKNDEMKEFIFRNLTREIEARKQSDVFLNSLYFAEISDGKLVFSRSAITKSFLLKAEKRERINFPVGFSFDFYKKYLISLEDNRFKVEEK
jgi:hypothetical protein